MIFSLSSNLKKAQRAVGVNGGRGQHFKERGVADVIGAGACNEDSPRRQHLQSTEVQFLVAAYGGIEIALGFGERRWIEHDGVVLLPRRLVLAQQLKRICFNPSLAILSPNALG